MYKIEVLVHVCKVEYVKRALLTLNADIIPISEMVAKRPASSEKVMYRGVEYRADLPMARLEYLVTDEHCDDLVNLLVREGRTSIGADDGIVLVSEVNAAIQVRTGMHLQYAEA